MNIDENIFNLAYLLLRPDIGQKHLKDNITKETRVRKCPNNFRENLEKECIQILPFWDGKYPAFLKEIPDFPVFLFLKGDVSLLERDFVTIVGSRKISQYSIKVLKEFFERKKEFSKNICFVSGLANGVDSEVHRHCLKKNLATIGVIGGGMDRVYYRGNSLMYQYLCKYRLVISEFPPGRKFFKGMFPLRNRILAGISKKTFIIQAGEKSGAINTASHANNYGRDVFVLPNNIFCEGSQGCLKLISQGANVVKNIDDFVSALD
jgi:DNA processing protein